MDKSEHVGIVKKYIALPLGWAHVEYLVPLYEEPSYACNEGQPMPPRHTVVAVYYPCRTNDDGGHERWAEYAGIRIW